MELLKYDNTWKQFYEIEKSHLLKALSGQKICGIEHIGATSVSSCMTAGTIDLLLSIQNSIDFFTIKNILRRKGYQCIEEKSDSVNVIFLVRRNAKRNIVATIRLVENGSILHQQILSFKFYLQEDQLHIKEYNDFRAELIKKYGDSIAKYQEEKSAYIESIINKL